MTSVFFADVSDIGNRGWVMPAGMPILIAKASEGRSFVDGSYVRFRSQARDHGAFFVAYHWLWPGRVEEQARHAFSVVGKTTPLMLDVEELSDVVGVGDIAGFVREYRRLGGTVTLLYLPRWYWTDHMRSPNLTSLKDLGLLLVASNYRAYSENNWPTGYGGMVPFQWQFTSSPIDMNAIRVSVQDYIRLVSGKEDLGMLTQDERDNMLFTIERYLFCIMEGIDASGEWKVRQSNGQPVDVPNSIRTSFKDLTTALKAAQPSSGGLSVEDRAAIAELTEAVTQLNSRLATP